MSRIALAGFFLAVFASIAAVLPVTTDASARASLGRAAWTCSNGYASVTFSWAPSSGVVQWLDISLFNNGFVPGTFLGAGPMNLGQNSLRWDGIKPGLVHYWRVNTLTNAGWVPSATGQIVPCGVSSASRPPAAPVSLTGLAGQLFDAHNVQRAAAGVGRSSLIPR